MKDVFIIQFKTSPSATYVFHGEMDVIHDSFIKDAGLEPGTKCGLYQKA